MTAVFIILAIIFIVAGTLLFVHYSSYLPPIACFIFCAFTYLWLNYFF